MFAFTKYSGNHIIFYPKAVEETDYFLARPVESSSYLKFYKNGQAWFLSISNEFLI